MESTPEKISIRLRVAAQNIEADVDLHESVYNKVRELLMEEDEIKPTARLKILLGEHELDDDGTSFDENGIAENGPLVFHAIQPTCLREANRQHVSIPGVLSVIVDAEPVILCVSSTQYPQLSGEYTVQDSEVRGVGQVTEPVESVWVAGTTTCKSNLGFWRLGNDPSSGSLLLFPLSPSFLPPAIHPSCLHANMKHDLTLLCFPLGRKSRSRSPDQ